MGDHSHFAPHALFAHFFIAAVVSSHLWRACAKEVTETTSSSPVTTSTAPPMTPALWDYTHTEDWPQWFASCAPAEEQSPIDIDSSLSGDGNEELSKCEYSSVSESGEAEIQLLNWTIKVFWPDKVAYMAKVNWQNKDYFLTSWHYHAPSDNTMDGKHFDMEVQHLHIALDGTHLVLSVFLEATSEKGYKNSFIQDMLESLPSQGSNTTTSKLRVPYKEMIPKDDQSYYTWIGTRSQPPCESQTTWVLMKKPVLVGADQLGKFRDALAALPKNILRKETVPPPGVSDGWKTTIGVNNRPTSQLGSRSIDIYYDPDAVKQSTSNHSDGHKNATLDWSTMGDPDAVSTALLDQLRTASQDPSKHWWVWVSVVVFALLVFFCPMVTVCLIVRAWTGGMGQSRSRPGRRKRRRRPMDTFDQEDVRPLVQPHHPQMALQYHPYYR